jgi:hypothetical protein
MATPPRPQHRHGLSFLATLTFTAGFFGARLFHLTFPDTMIFFGDIHFHHFWYGLAMIGVAGWLGIVTNDERYNRIYALVFGLGAGFIGDEVGLLLTGDNYYSNLTFEFFVVAMAAVILITLFLRYRKEIEQDILRVDWRQRLVLTGVFLVGFSSVVIGHPFVGVPILVGGILLALWGFVLRRRSNQRPAS